MDAPYPRHNLRPRNVAAAERRRQRAYDRAIADLEMREADLLALRHPPAPQPRRTHWTVALINIISAIIIVAVFAAIFWPLVAPYLRSPAPSGAPAVPTMRPVAPPQSAPAAESGSQAPALPAESGSSTPVVSSEGGATGNSALPTAVVNIPAPASVVTLDPAAPLRYAPGSGPAPTAAPAPTVVTTEPMVAGKDFSHNAAQTCVETTRDSDGARVRFCQETIMSVGAMSSVADFLRTGRIVGEVVK